jgi:uncharacterized protein (DUF1697 family)
MSKKPVPAGRKKAVKARRSSQSSDKQINEMQSHGDSACGDACHNQAKEVLPREVSMNTNTYVALLRGINVGGNNVIRMGSLREAFERAGCTCVKTYIQSGNVIFDSKTGNVARVLSAVKKSLSISFDYHSAVFLYTAKEYMEIIRKAPPDFGSQPDFYKYDVWFLKPPLTGMEVVALASVREDVDQLYAGEGAVYTTRQIKRLPQSRLSKINQLPIYHKITIRNWNTSRRLSELLDQL